MLPPIIGLTGPIRAGKSTAAEYFCSKYGYQLASNSDILRRILSNMNMDPTRDNLSRMGDSIFKVLGNDIIAQFRIANLSAGRIVVDGLRYQDELDRYKTAKGFKLIGIVAPTEARYERSIMTGAAMKDKGLTREKFALSATVRSEQEVPLLIQQADQIIENNLDVTALHSKIDYIMTTWKQL